MASFVAEAIEIITDTGNGIPTTYTNTAIGLASDGHFYLITGRFGLDGSKTITATDDCTSRTIWYEQVIAADFSPGISRNADFTEVGTLETVSGFSFPLINTQSFRDLLKANSVHLAKRTVKYYRVTSSDGTTFNFEQRWQGVIDDQPFDELTYQIQCVTAKEIFKSLPNRAVTASAFESAPIESQDKMIPIALGRMAYSPLVNVAKTGEKTTLNIISSVEYKVAAVSAGSADWLRLVTRGVTFSENELEGKYVSVIAGGVPQILRIGANDETTASGGVDSETTLVYTDDPVDVREPIVPWNQTTSGDNLALWYAEVVDYLPVLVASTKPISEFVTNPSSRPRIATYQSERNKYEDISELNITKSLTNIGTTGFPGCSILAKSADTDGSLFSYFNIVPTAIRVVEVSGFWSFEDLPAVGLDAPILRDQVGVTGHTLVTNSASQSTVVFDVELPSEDILKQFKEIYVLPDLTHSKVGGGQTRIDMTIWGKDIYGRLSQLLVDEDRIKESGISGSEVLNYLPREYYGSTGDNASFFADKLRFNVAELLGDSKKASAYTSIRFKLDFSDNSVLTSYTLNLRQIGVVGKRAVGVSSESLNGSLIGETYGTTWDGRKTAASPIQNIAEGLEHLVRNYDTSEGVWQGGRAYVVGDTIRATADNGQIFVCTVAGTSHTSSEPTWTDTAGATYADGTVTWRQLREIPIDTTSFNTVGNTSTGTRKDWFFGRTLIDKKKSEEYYKEIFAQAFLIGAISPTGKLRATSWLDNTTPALTFNTTNILQGSLGQMKPTPARQVYNDFLIRYDWNPGAKKFNKQIAITNVDKPVFPGEFDTVDPGTNLGAFVVDYQFPINGKYEVFFDFPVDIFSLISTGDLATLSGNTHGFNFPPTEVEVTVADGFRLLTLAVSPTIAEGVTSTTGIVKKVTNINLAWKEYVSGIDDYQTAKDLWDDCHASYVISKSVNKLPQELGDCHWFIDPYAKDEANKYIWSTDGTEATLDLDVGDEHPAVFYLRNLIAWTTRQKLQIEFETIDNSTYSALQIGSTVAFVDAKLTAGVTVTGWIHEKTQLPRTDKLPERFRFGVTLEP